MVWLLTVKMVRAGFEVGRQTGKGIFDRRLHFLPALDAEPILQLLRAAAGAAGAHAQVVNCPIKTQKYQSDRFL